MTAHQAVRIGLVAFVAGCAGMIPNRLARADADPLDLDNSFENVQLLDDTLNSKIEVTRVGSQPSRNGLLSVFAGFRNKTDHRLDLDIETIYKDNAGRQLNNASWLEIKIDAHQEQSYLSSSISEEAVGFTIRIRPHGHVKKG